MLCTYLFLVELLEAIFDDTPLHYRLDEYLQRPDDIETVEALRKELQTVVENPDADRETVGICRDAIYWL